MQPFELPSLEKVLPKGGTFSCLFQLIAGYL